MRSHAIHLITEGSLEAEQPPPAEQRAQADVRQADWHTLATSLTSSNEDVYRAYRQSIEDMGALRMEDGDGSPHTWVPAAGIPWYATVFGRDSLIVALQTMAVNPGLGVGTLHALARLQASATDDWRDAQPGKMPHEIRFGELAHFGKVPHTPYYGSADATPLYLIALHETWLWTGDHALLEQHRDTAERCLEWIDRYGDLDGDGFQEYLTRSTQGLENQGWKDSGDAVVDPAGAKATPPIALCELQGYVYDAKRRMAEVFEALGAGERAAALRQQAEELQQRFEAAFWLEEEGTLLLWAGCAQAADSHGRVERRPLPVVGDRAPRARRAGGAAADAGGYVERLGHSHAERQPSLLQPAQLSSRLGLAARQWDYRGGLPALRLCARGRPAGAWYLGSDRLL